MGTRLRTLWLMATLVSGATTVSAGPDSRVDVCILDSPQISYRVVVAAQGLASQIYRKAGIRLLWANRCTAPMVKLTLLTREREAEMIRQLHPGRQVLGFALAPTRRIYLFYDRMSLTGDTLFERLLARVIAHEIGHVLLPGQGHSVRGLMRSQTDLKEPPTFSGDERQSMHRFLLTGMTGREAAIDQ